jgi:hypothetical protein
MERVTTGDIRKITVGDVKTGFVFTVGQEINGYQITGIYRDENSYFLFKSIRYLIEAKDRKGVIGIWKYFENQPVAVEIDFK